MQVGVVDRLVRQDFPPVASKQSSHVFWLDSNLARDWVEDSPHFGGGTREQPRKPSLQLRLTSRSGALGACEIAPISMQQLQGGAVGEDYTLIL